MNETLAQLIRLAYDNPDLRSLLLPIIISEIDPQLLLKTAKRKKRDKRPNIDRHELARRKKEKQEKMLTDFEFIAHIKRTQKDNNWVDPNTNLENNINSVISKARGDTDATGQNISQEWARGIISDLYEEHREKVDADTAYGGDEYKAELDQLHEMLDDLANKGDLDELKKESRNACVLISRKMSEGAFVDRVGAISKAADNFLWGLERQVIPIQDLLTRLYKMMDDYAEGRDRGGDNSESLLDDELLGEAAKVLGNGVYQIGNLEFEIQVEALKEMLGEAIGKEVLEGIKKFGKDAIGEGTLKVLEATVGTVGGGVVEAIASAFGLEHKLRKVKGNIVEAIGNKADKLRGTKGSGQHWEEKFLQATMTPAAINDEYQGKVDEISAKVKKAESKEDVLSLIGEVRNATDQYYTEAKVDIERSIQRSVVYKRMDGARNRGNEMGFMSKKKKTHSESLDLAVAGVSNIVNLVSKGEAKAQDFIRSKSKVAAQPKHAGISLLLMERELEKAYADQMIIEAFESEIPKMFERSIDILKDRDKRDLIFGVKDKEIRESFNKLTEAKD